MAVIGGSHKSIFTRLLEIGGWFPLLSLLVAAGGMSFLDANHMMMAPEWAQGPLKLYRDARTAIASTMIGKSFSPNYADLAVMGIGLVTMLSRKLLSFTFSIGGFIVLAVIASLLLKKFA